MKKLFFTFAILFTGFVFAQNIEPKLEVVGQLVKATYYYDNGKIQQEGFFKDGKLDGKWISYEESGAVKAVAEFISGEKTGKWSFYSNGVASNEVSYSNNQIASVINLKGNVIADKN